MVRVENRVYYMCCDDWMTDLVGDEGCEWWRGLVAVEPVAVWGLQGWLCGVRVLGVAVAPQVHLALESLVAQSAREGLVTSVLAHMRYQIRTLAERLRAHHAFVRFLT